MLLKFPVHGMGKLWLRYSNSYGKTLHVDKAFKTSSESRYQNSIKQNEIVGRILSGSQVISLCHHIVNLFKHLSILENIILRYLFLIFVLSLHWQLNSITLQSHSSQHNILIIGPCYVDLVIVLLLLLVHHLNVRGPFRWVMIFSTSIDPFKSMVTVRRKFISFHQNNEIVHFISFNSFARNYNVRYCHGNDFLPFNLDHGQTY